MTEQSEIDPRLKKMIAGALAELDRQQIAILRTLTPAQRFYQACSMIEISERVAAYRLMQRDPTLDLTEALRKIRSGEAFSRHKIREQE